MRGKVAVLSSKKCIAALKEFLERRELELLIRKEGKISRFRLPL